MQGYEKQTFTAPLGSGHQVSHAVYARGAGPVVVIIQELPGIGAETLALADTFVVQGFRVVLPHLFGPLGRVSMLGNLVRVFCMRREFQLFQKRGTSPIVDWLRALCRDIREREQVDGVGVIGMCLTGNFAISLMAEDAVLASVASQPSLPMNAQADLHMSDADVTAVRERLDRTEPMLAYRFDGDGFCQAAKFSQLADTFNQDRERIRLRTLPGDGHSVLTLDFVDEAGHPTRDALDEILGYFRATLGEAQE